MKKILMIIVLLFTFENQAENNLELTDYNINNTIEELCKDVDSVVFEEYRLLACIDILKLGVNKNLFNSYYVFYNAIESGINFKNLDSNIFYSKMKTMKKTNKELNIFNNIKK